MTQAVNSKTEICMNYVEKPKYTNIRQYLSNTKVVDCDFCEEPEYDDYLITVGCYTN